MMKRNPNSQCEICGNGLYCPPSRKAAGFGRFCSKSCMGKAKAGVPLPKEICSAGGKAAGITSRSRNQHKWETINCLECGKTFRGLVNYSRQFCSMACKHTASRLTILEMSYGTLHSRVREAYGTPSECEYCGATEGTKFEWANISRLYNSLDRSDWARLCVSCHRRYDAGIKNKIEVLI